MTNYIPYEDDSDFLLVNATSVEVDNFCMSVLHADFQREVQSRIDMLTHMLNDADLKYTGRQCDVFRGGIKAFTEVLNLFIDIQTGLIESTGSEGDERC